jgi:hypothetical protein
MSCRSGSEAADAVANLIVRRCRRQRDDLLGKNRSRPSTVRTESAVTLGLCPEQDDCILEGANQASMRSTLQRTSCSHGAGGRMAACSGAADQARFDRNSNEPLVYTEPETGRLYVREAEVNRSHLTVGLMVTLSAFAMRVSNHLILLAWNKKR